MANSNPAVSFDSKELYSLINYALPNIAQYIKVILKKEKLSEEGESKRQKYESFLNSLEQEVSCGGRPHSFICDDDSGYFSANRNRDFPLPEQPAPPIQNQSGYLLWQDEKTRWHRCWCRAENRDMRFYIYEDINEEILLRSFSLENTTTEFGGHVIVDSGKDNSFMVSGALYDALGVSTGNEMEASSSPVDICFAAYTDSELKKWKDVIQLLSSCRDSTDISLSLLDGNSWLPQVNMVHDSTSSSSSNFSSNRESLISNTSSLVNTHRMSSRSDLGDGKEHTFADDAKSLSVSKQQQPLPSPPHQTPILTTDEQVSSTSVARSADDEDNDSVGTIYESIDNLVLQFDDAIRQIGENMKSDTDSTKQQKKKDRSLFRQHSFLSRKSTKSKLLSEKQAELEKGERYSGVMLKKNNSGSWKKKWCVLKGCIFGYYKSQSDSQGHEYVILNGEIVQVQDSKKNFVFCLRCKGIPEMYLAVEEEEVYYEWFSKLYSACNSAAEYADALQPADLDPVKAIVNESSKFADSIYNVPRSLFLDSNQVYDTPRGNSTFVQSVPMSPDAAIDAGIYNVPRSLMMQDVRSSEERLIEAQYLLGVNPLDIYDFPRASMSPDEEGIYDDPLDIVDMEIYDYPPDANELGLEDSGLGIGDCTRSSTISMSSEVSQTDRESSTLSGINWSTLAVPPLPSSARPSIAISIGSNSDDNQNFRNSVSSGDIMIDRPRSHSSRLSNSPSDNQLSITEGVKDNFVGDTSAETSLEYGQCALRGYLYKKERFMTWMKLFCIIRNNFLECNKSHHDTYSPVLKLFLPGSEVKEGGGDAKKKWAFQVRHPRREGVLTFAADSSEESYRWIKAFQSGASIQVQPVNTVEEIRITDLEMQKRWTTTLDKEESSRLSFPSEDINVGLPPRSNTYSAGSVAEDFASDTLKRRRKFSWVKSNFMRRKNEKKSLSGSQIDLNSNRMSNISLDVNSEKLRQAYATDPLRKSVSLELLPTTTESDESPVHSKSELVRSQEGKEQFQGYLRVQRKGADNVWVRYWCILENSIISCYISQRDLTLTLSIHLCGSRVAEAEFECHRKHSFKVLHVESGQCLYFAADDHEEFFRWFAEVTKGGEQVLCNDSATVAGSFVAYNFNSKDDNSTMKFRRLSVLSEGGSSNASEGSTVSSSQSHATVSNGIFYRGELMKASHTGKWKQRYCVVKDGFLSIYHSSVEKSPITSITLYGCSLELVSTAHNSPNEYQFKLNPAEVGKSHTFAAPSETEMYAWVSALRDATCVKPVSLGEEKKNGGDSSDKSSLKRKNKKLKDADLISYVLASSLNNPDYSGFTDIQYGTEPWTKYWCVAFGNCLYIYQSKSAAFTIKTVVLPGYEVKVGELRSTKYNYNLSLTHEGVSPVWMSLQNQDELDNWVNILGKYTRAEGVSRQKRISGKLLPDEGPKVLPHKVSSKSVLGSKKKGPVRADHNISAIRAANEEGSISSESSTATATSKQIESIQGYQDAIIRRYEKRIRKTHRVANLTEQKLKKQQASLLHFKKELSRHVVKLQDLSNSGDPHAQKRLKNVRNKLAQVDKIVPYLGKYVAVNRQAEMQTVSVLKESCTMELQKFSQRTSPKNFPESSPVSKPADAQLNTGDAVSLPPPPSNVDFHQPAAENSYASLSEVRKEAASKNVKARSNYAELDFTKMSGENKLRPPSVKYSEVRIDSYGKGKIVSPSEHPSEKKDQDVPATSLAVKEPTASPTKELCETGEPIETNSLLHDDTLTPENVAMFVNTTPIAESLQQDNIGSDHSTPGKENRIAAIDPPPSLSPISSDDNKILGSDFNSDKEKFPPPTPPRIDSIPMAQCKLKSPPPPVAKKPTTRLSPIHKLHGQSSDTCRDDCTNTLNEEVSINPEEKQESTSFGNTTLTTLQGTPSIIDRIKALQQH